LKSPQRSSFEVGLLIRSKPNYKISLSNLYVIKKHLCYKSTRIILKDLRIFGVIFKAVVLVLLVCAADLSIAYDIGTLSAKTMFKILESAP
jgi:hypothetical protein